MHPRWKAEMIEKVQPFVDCAFSRKTVFLFGHCNATEELCDYLLENHCVPHCFLDNNQKKQGTFYGDIPILSPDVISSFSSEDCIVLIASRFFHTMSEQLHKLGYEGDIVETVEYNSYQAFSIEESVFQQKKQRVLDGFACFETYHEKFPQRYFVLCPYSALGDVYLAMSYLEAYCEKHHIFSFVVFTVGNPCGEVARLFTKEPVISLGQKEMDAFVQAVLLMGIKTGILAHHNHFYTDSSFQILQSELISFPQYYRDVVFGLDDTVEMAVPLHGKEVSCKEKIPKGRSVILAPYANSVVEAPKSFWTDLVKGYQAEGLHVFTNIIEGQEPLDDTTSLVLPISEMCDAVCWAGYFVSLRSGLCDVVHTAKARKTVVFPHCCFSDTKHQISDFFKLEGWETIIL